MTKLEARNSKLEIRPAAATALVRDFKDFDVWKSARNLQVLIYALVRKLPVEERFALTASSGVLCNRSVRTLPQRVIQTLNGYIRSTSKRPAESRKDR